MTRRRAPKRKTTEPAPGWIWMLFGLGLGLAVAAAIHFQHRDRMPGDETIPAANAPVPSAPAAASPTSGSSDETRPAQAPPPEPSRFLFYEMLPQFEVVIPDPPAAAAAEAPARASALDSGSYVLQVGSFSRFEDADRMRATLALRGIESFIQRVQIDEDTYHRVRIGPVDDLDHAEQLRRDLGAAQVDALLIRLSD